MYFLPFFLFLCAQLVCPSDGLTVRTGNHTRSPKVVWLPIFPVNIATTVSPQVVTQPPVPQTQALLPFQQVALMSINSVRIIHNVPPLTWNAELAATAQRCADEHASASSTNPCSLITIDLNAAEEIGFSLNPLKAEGTLAAILDTNVGSWFGNQWGTDPPCIDFDSAAYMFQSACSGFSQMIWRSTTEVGCGYSDRTGTFPLPGDPAATPQAGFHVLSCLYRTPGNSPSNFQANVPPSSQ